MSPHILIVMGVSGSGKSYLGERLADATGWPFAEGDDFHSEANKAKMHAGIPLTDEDRRPWLDALHDLLEGWHKASTSGILSCSSLKAAYRQRLDDSLPEVRFVWLDIPRAVLVERLSHRKGHFMPLELLDSQLATLEPPVGERNTLRLDGSGPVEEQIRTILAWLEDEEPAED